MAEPRNNLAILGGLLRRRQVPWTTSGLLEQSRVDAAPVGSVGAPGGNALAAPMGAGGTGHDSLRNMMLGFSHAPLVGDALGLFSDVRLMQQQPETRTLGNALMMGLGVLPAVPPLGYLMSRRVEAPALARGLRGQRGILGEVMIDMGGGPRKVIYGENPTPEELDYLFGESFILAEEQASKRYGVKPSQLTKKQLYNHGAGALRAIESGAGKNKKQYFSPANATLHEYLARALGLDPDLPQARGMAYEDGEKFFVRD